VFLYELAQTECEHIKNINESNDVTQKLFGFSLETGNLIADMQALLRTINQQ
jgi:hypothetical protein